MKHRFFIGLAIGTLLVGSSVYAQRSVKKPRRAAPPTFKPNEFSGVFFSDAFSQLSGELPSEQTAVVTNGKPDKPDSNVPSGSNVALNGNSAWKELIARRPLKILSKNRRLGWTGL